MSLTPTIIAAVIAAVALLLGAALSRIPERTSLRRLERIIAVLEKVQDPKAQAPLLALRNRLIDEVAPTKTTRSPASRVGIGLDMGALIPLGVSLFLLTLGPDARLASTIVMAVAYIAVAAAVVLIIVGVLSEKRRRQAELDTWGL
jgi:Flp pilus assembly protein TadB